MEKLEYKFIRFEETTLEHEDHPVFDCYNKKNGDFLARVFYFPKWKKFVFTQADEGIIFDKKCLEDIADFIGRLEDNNGQ